MSLELALKENTDTMKELIAALQASSKVAVTAKAEPAKKPASSPAAPAPAVATPASTVAAPVAEPSTSIDFDTLKKVFLQLAGKDRSSAEAVLKEFKVAKLTELKSEQYVAAHDAVVKALG